MGKPGYGDVLARLEELERRVAQMVVRGTVHAVDTDAALARVRYGEDEKGAALVTGWLPWKPIRTGRATVWWAPEVGEGVTIISDGVLAHGEILPGSYHTAMPAPSSDPDLFLVEFGDGSAMSHHRGNKHFDLSVTGPGTAAVTAQGGVTVRGDTVIEGTLTVTKDIAGQANISASKNVSAGQNVSDATGSMARDREIYNQHGHDDGPAPLPKQ